MSIEVRAFGSDDDEGAAAFRSLEPAPPAGPARPPESDAVLLIGFRRDDPVARASARVADGLVGAPDPVGVIGHYEAVDAEAGVAVLGEARRVLASRGIAGILGPMDGTTWDRYRLALPTPEAGDPSPFLTEPVNPLEYGSHWEASGFEVAEHYVSRLETDLSSLAERAGQVGPELERAGVRLEALEPARFDQTLDQIHALSLDAFAGNAFYSPIGRERFRAMYAPIRERIDPELVVLARDGGERLIGFMLTFPDLLDPATRQVGRPTRTVLKSLAVAPSQRGSGLGTLLMHDAQRRAAERGYTGAIHALMHADNASVRISSRGGELFRRYALYRAAP